MIADQSIFRAYDMRGLYPSQMNEAIAFAAGQAFVQILGAKKVVVGRDVRPSGVSLEEAMIRGITEAGADVIRVGVISTDMLYYAAGTLDCDGGMSITASHNPHGWNGIKFIAKGAKPITKEGELGQIYDFINSGQKISQFEHGTVTDHDLLPDFVSFLKKHIPADLPAMKLVLNPNFGALGKVLDATLEGTPLEIVRLNWVEDGTFPKGTPDPLLPSNRKEISETVVAEKATLGFAFDADADRCFCFDEQGRFFHGYYLTCLISETLLAENPGAAIVAERRLVRGVRETVAKNGGELVYSKTGHGYFKNSMRQHNAVFGGEVSGHFYYREFFGCDSGIFTLITLLKRFSQALAAGQTVGTLLDAYMAHYPVWPQELNFIVPDSAVVLAAAKEKFSDAELNDQEGYSFEFPTWYFNMRLSANEPVMRVNIEAATAEEVTQHQEELMELVTSHGGTLRNDE